MLFTYERLVEFADTDAAGIAHFTKIIQYMESAEHALLRSIGLSVMPHATREATHSQPKASAAEQDPAIFEFADLSWPRVKVDVDYSGAAYFEDKLRIDARIAKIGRSSLQYEFFVRQNNASEADPKPIAHGIFTVVCCRIRKNQPLESVEIPAILRERLQKYT